MFYQTKIFLGELNQKIKEIDMSIVEHKDIIVAWLNGATVQSRRPFDDHWSAIKQAENCDDMYFVENYKYRIKPKTKTTWLWVAEIVTGKQ